MRRIITLSALVLLPAVAIADAKFPNPPKYPAISGDYICTDHCDPNGGIAKVGQDGGFLTLINEKNQGTSGYFESEKMIRSKAGGGWNAVRAVINADGSLSWENGTIWRKK